MILLSLDVPNTVGIWRLTYPGHFWCRRSLVGILGSDSGTQGVSASLPLVQCTSGDTAGKVCPGGKVGKSVVRQRNFWGYNKLLSKLEHLGMLQRASRHGRQCLGSFWFRRCCEGKQEKWLDN